MLELGAVFLTATLLGLPRVLGGGAASIRARSVYVKVAPSDPELQSFALALEAALESERYMSVRPSQGPTLIVEIHDLARLRLSDGTSRSSVRIMARAGHKTLPLVLDYGDPRAAARALLEHLPPVSIAAC